jgi:hypothetical protein
MTSITSSLFPRRALAVCGLLALASLTAPAVAQPQKIPVQPAPKLAFPDPEVREMQREFDERNNPDPSRQYPVTPPAPATSPNSPEENERLSRDCKGRPNAGACAGYAR